MTTTDWTIPGAEGEQILGTTHPCASGEPRACVLLAHGFKGYKDYGFIPVLTATLAATIPVVAHRFNFSHSGMNEDVSTFGRPDLFENDTWGKQIFDLGACVDAAVAGDLPHTPAGLPVAILGHSRGGVSCLLFAAQRFNMESSNKPTCLITMAAPSRANTLNEDERDMLRETGSIETLSSRTGQTLHIGKQWLLEQLEDPYTFDVLAACTAIQCPVLAIHGEADSTVLPGAASMIADTCPDGHAHLIFDASHVFNTPNPADPQQAHSQALTELIGVVSSFISANAIRS
jgi:pimeloyl-ACP methyl ester carboxylesterase